MAAATATAISAINATPPDAKPAMIMALTTATVLIHLHIAMSLHKDLMIIYRNPAPWVTRRRSKIASAFCMLESSASLQLTKNTWTPFSNFEDPLIASSVFLIVSSMLETSSEIPTSRRQPVGLYLQAWPRIWSRDDRVKIQQVARALTTSRLRFFLLLLTVWNFSPWGRQRLNWDNLSLGNLRLGGFEAHFIFIFNPRTYTQIHTPMPPFYKGGGGMIEPSP